MTERDAQAAVGVARSDQREQRDLPTANAHGDGVRVGNAELLGRARADEHRVVPGQLGERLGQLLQPSVVRVAAVDDLRVDPEYELQLAVAQGEAAELCFRQRDLTERLERGQGARYGAALQHAGRERATPSVLAAEAESVRHAHER